MAWVYILKGARYYVGSTTDLERRIAEHKRGHNSTSKRIGRWNLAWSKKCPTLKKARTLEKKIKNWKSNKMIERIIAGTTII